MPRLGVITASVREGRAGAAVAEWFLEIARRHGAFEVAPMDLKEIDLPLLQEPAHPRLQKYTHEKTKRWSAAVAMPGSRWLTPVMPLNRWVKPAAPARNAATPSS